MASRYTDVAHVEGDGMRRNLVVRSKPSTGACVTASRSPMSRST